MKNILDSLKFQSRGDIYRGKNGATKTESRGSLCTAGWTTAEPLTLCCLYSPEPNVSFVLIFPATAGALPIQKVADFYIGHRIGLDTFASNCSRCVYFILSPLLSFHLSDHLNIFLQNFCLFYIFLSPLYSPFL